MYTSPLAAMFDRPKPPHSCVTSVGGTASVSVSINQKLIRATFVPSAVDADEGLRQARLPVAESLPYHGDLAVAEVDLCVVVRGPDVGDVLHAAELLACALSKAQPAIRTPCYGRALDCCTRDGVLGLRQEGYKERALP